MRDTAILNTHSSVTTINAGIDAWDKDGNVVVLDESKITTELARLQAEYDALAYSRNREAEYPSIQECVHAILDDDLTALQEKRQAVKTKYPKS
jgi:hypothetical protein